jgi:hypothetical protein
MKRNSLFNISIQFFFVVSVDVAEIQSLIFYALSSEGIEYERLFSLILNRLNEVPNLVAFHFEYLIRLCRHLRRSEKVKKVCFLSFSFSLFLSIFSYDLPFTNRFQFR